MNHKPRVLVAMSGGVDSSVAACLLHERGFDVIGVFMRLGGDAAHPRSAPNMTTQNPAVRSLSILTQSDEPRHRGCCSASDASDARSVAAKLGIPFYALNFEADFSRLISHFADEYALARTPNPCIRCNQDLKFGRLFDYADAIGADLIATGHYARIDLDHSPPRLLRARSPDKDQSYVLFGLDPTLLSRLRFPLGDLTKTQVRAEARRFGLSLHDKPDSQDICFVQDRDYAAIVRDRRPDSFRPGLIRHVDGRILGRHDGLPQFTIGQRRGLRIAAGEPIYVVDLDPDTDTVTVGPRDAVLARELIAENVNWLINSPAETFRADVKIRYAHDPAPAEISPLPGDRIKIRFDSPQAAITPGQAAVIHCGDHVLGGAWISRISSACPELARPKASPAST